MQAGPVLLPCVEGGCVLDDLQLPYRKGLYGMNIPGELE